MKQPNWQTKFRDLPEIPIHKRWTKNSSSTREQIISFKLINKQLISEEEVYVFLELANFYSELYVKLEALDYSSFSNQDISNFKDYILYAFNYNALIKNDLTIYTTYRLVVNEHVTGKNESIHDVNFLKYPQLDLVRKIGKFNRSNTINTNIFYSTENIDTALKEIQPPLNKLITVGVWKPKTDKKFISYPIFDSEIAAIQNVGANNAKTAFEEHFQYNPPLLMHYMKYYFKLLGREYSKKVNHHYEYIISALLSEQILTKNSNSHFHYDCIKYPSVGNDHVTDNVAILPSVLDKDFYLSKVIEFEVEEAFYNREYVVNNPEKISLAKVKKVKEAKNITHRGEINW